MCDLDRRAFFGRAMMVSVSAYEAGSIASSTQVLVNVTPFTRVNPLLAVKANYGRLSHVVRYAFVDDCLVSRRKVLSYWGRFSLGCLYLNQGVVKSVFKLGSKSLLSMYGAIV